eukprot:m.136399 g.136399  ORF g.136399 m.136399 type:complete len:84 (+) comp17571_c0_seq37:987-1238(+)
MHTSEFKSFAMQVNFDRLLMLAAEVFLVYKQMQIASSVLSHEVPLFPSLIHHCGCAVRISVRFVFDLTQTTYPTSNATCAILA